MAESATLFADHHGLYVAGHASVGVNGVERHRGRSLGQKGNVGLHPFSSDGHVLQVVHPEGFSADNLQDGIVTFLYRGLDRHGRAADLDDVCLM